MNNLADIGGGLLSFPATAFRDGAVDLETYGHHVDWMASQGAAGLFSAGATGEFYAMSPDEIESVVRVAVEAVNGRLPVYAPAGFNATIAIDLARRAAAVGASGLLLFPPYLVETSQEGLAEYVRAVCSSTDLPVVLYNRGNARYEPGTVARLCDTIPNLAGLKDGVGDLDHLGRIIATVGDRLTYIGGIPTAEMIAVPSLSIGVSTYSSALFNFLPTFALAFYNAARSGDSGFIRQSMVDFLIPYSTLRSRDNGYAISIVKAGMRVIGRDAGPVRPPIADLRPSEVEELGRLIEVARNLA